MSMKPGQFIKISPRNTARVHVKADRTCKLEFGEQGHGMRPVTITGDGLLLLADLCREAAGELAGMGSDDA